VWPPDDHGNITAILAANLAFELLSLLALNRAGMIPPAYRRVSVHGGSMS
jgi:hypothetical protein